MGYTQTHFSVPGVFCGRVYSRFSDLDARSDDQNGSSTVSLGLSCGTKLYRSLDNAICHSRVNRFALLIDYDKFAKYSHE
ncbi:MAG: hypothetical protein LHW60_07180 [Candidatus Cloacimonetes bacterium]|nr:hypothetical protein [Candidatus Cloacimonadota bacterium]